MAEKHILDYDEVEEISSDDYILIDNETDGVRKILASAIAGGGGKVLDPNYTYHKYGDNDEIIVRVYHEGQSDQRIDWFFNGYSLTAGIHSIPSQFSAYYNTSVDQAALAYNASTDEQEACVVVNRSGQMGIYYNGFGSYYEQPIKARLSMNYPDNSVQQTAYSDPYVYISSGDLTKVEITQAEYEELTQEEKMDGSKIYFVPDAPEESDLARRMTSNTSDDGTVSANRSYSSDFKPWHALASESTFDASVNGEYWAGSDNGAYLQFDFNEAVTITKIGFASYLACSFDIMYSTDGTIYTVAQSISQNQTALNPTRIDTVLSHVIRDCTSIRIQCVSGNKNLGALHFWGYKDNTIKSKKVYYMGVDYSIEEDDYTLYSLGNSTDYIQLPYAVGNHEIEIKFYLKQYVHNTIIYGTTLNGYYPICFMYNNQFTVNAGNGYGAQLHYTPNSFEGEHTLIHNRVGDGAIVFDGNNIGTFVNTSSGTSLVRIGSTLGASAAEFNLEYFKITQQDGTPVANYVPKFRTLSNGCKVACLYNEVDDTYLNLASTITICKNPN